MGHWEEIRAFSPLALSWNVGVSCRGSQKGKEMSPTDSSTGGDGCGAESTNSPAPM
jgi:hypothetical protein